MGIVSTSLKTWLRGIRLLRYAELVGWLGREQARLLQLRAVHDIFRETTIADSVHLIGWQPDLLKLQVGVTISSGTIIAFGDERNGFSKVSIGERTWIGEYNNIRSGGGEITIGDDCMISQFVSIIGSGHSLERYQAMIKSPPPTDRLGVTIYNDVWIGAGATILPGVQIGNGAVVGAGAVVSKSVGPFEIVAGVPAKLIGVRH